MMHSVNNEKIKENNRNKITLPTSLRTDHRGKQHTDADEVEIAGVSKLTTEITIAT